MKRYFVFLGVVLTTVCSIAGAQEIDYIPDISLDMRGGYGQNFTEGSGSFYGDGLYLDINGYISPHFSYSLNQRLASTYYEDNSGFNGTNWLTLTYEVGSFAFTAGKDAILTGSFEYDAYDLDSYYNMNSLFYNMFDCWQWGVSAIWYPTDTQSIIIQAANSPLSYGEPNLFAYAAGWRGEWDVYGSYWTANLWQYDRGCFIKSVNLGNRFTFGSFSFDYDLMMRFGEIEDMAGISTTLAPSYRFGEWGRIFAKGGWESIGFDDPGNFFYGAGFEYYPLKERKDVRLHLAWSHNDWLSGDILDIGLTWKFDITGTAKHLFSRFND